MALRIRDWKTHFESAASRKLKRLDWVAVPNKTDGEGYMTLVDHPNGAAHLGAWYAIVECASRQKVRGNLPPGIPQDDGGICQGFGGICRAVSKISQLPVSVFLDVVPRLLKIGWLEEYHDENQSVAESATSLGESANGLGKSQAHITGQNITEHDKTKSFGASAPSESLFPADLASPVRSVVPAEPTFEDWWKVWWNPTAKAKAKKLWPTKAKQYGAQFLIEAVIADRQRFEPTTSWEWRSQLHPTTWLNGKRWEDQLPPNGKSSMPVRSQTSTVDRALAIMGQRIKNGERPV